MDGAAAAGNAVQTASVLSWMAWTTPTAIFFTVIACLLILMTAWEIKVPGGDPRHGVLGLDTTRGDRLFISLLGSAVIHLAWLGLFGDNLWPALAVSVAYALAVFRWV